MRHHRIIWYMAATAVLLAATIIAVRRTAEAPADAEANRQLVASFLAAIERDSQAREPATRSLINRVATLAKLGELDSAEGYYALGLRLRFEGRPAQAVEAFRKAILLKPDWSRPHNSLGVVLYRLGRANEAEASFRRAIELDPESSRAHNDLAVLLRLEGRLDEAQPEALRAVELGPDDLAANNNYGNMLVALGRYDEAEKYYQTASALDPDHPAPHYNLACLASLRGRHEEAFSFLARAIRLDSAFREEARKDPHLAPLREHPRFEELVGSP